MIVDADCHISSRSDPSLPWIVGDELVERLDRASCHKAIVWLSPPYDRNIEPENEAVYRACLKYPDRFIGFGWANPRLGKERTEAAIRRSFEEYGFHGIKFNGAQDGYVIDDPLISMPYLEMAARYGKVLAFHRASGSSRESSTSRSARTWR